MLEPIIPKIWKELVEYTWVKRRSPRNRRILKNTKFWAYPCMQVGMHKQNGFRKYRNTVKYSSTKYTEKHLYFWRKGILGHMLKKKKWQNQKKPKKTGVLGLISLVLTGIYNVLMFTTCAIPIVTAIPLPGRVVVLVALMDPVPGVTVVQPASSFLSSLLLRLQAWPP